MIFKLFPFWGQSERPVWSCVFSILCSNLGLQLQWTHTAFRECSLFLSMDSNVCRSSWRLMIFWFPSAAGAGWFHISISSPVEVYPLVVLNSWCQYISYCPWDLHLSLHLILTGTYEIGVIPFAKLGNRHKSYRVWDYIDRRMSPRSACIQSGS